MTEHEVSPRTDADARIAQAFEVVVGAGGEQGQREYAPAELDTLFFTLNWALVQLKRVPGGAEALARLRGDVSTERARRVAREVAADAKIEAIDAALDRLGVPRATGYGEPVSSGQPLDAEARVLRLGAERDQLQAERIRLRNPFKDAGRRVQRVVAVRACDLTDDEREHAHPTGTPGMWEVSRWDDSDAVKLVKRAFGDDVDLADGGVGDTMVKMVTAEMQHLDRARNQFLQMAAAIRPSGEEP